MPPSDDVQSWESRGSYRSLMGHRCFTLDTGAVEDGDLDPLLILHGFPTCSLDFHRVVDQLASRRRVLLLDFLGFGLSDKPDVHYSIEMQADIVQSFVADLHGMSPSVSTRAATEVVEEDPRARIAMLSHDMGDTVAGELLARQAEGRWDVEVSRRVVTNGSIYIEMAHLTDGQQFLLALPDERLQTSIDSSGASMMEALSATFSPSASVPGDELRAAWELISHNGGDLLLPRLIRYIEDRRRNQSRYTGAIESHPSPLAIIWGSEDPIAVPAMASRLESVRNDSTLVFMDGVGHYPMIETPELFTAELIEALGS